MNQLPTDSTLYNRIHAALVGCGAVADNAKVQTAFIDSRIKPFGDNLPQAGAPSDRAWAIIGFLNDRYRSDTQENALVLLLRVLSGRIDPLDAWHSKLLTLADELEREKQPGDRLLYVSGGGHLLHFVLLGIGGLIVGAVLMFLVFPLLTKPAPTASLVSMRYITCNFAPRMVDLRTVSTNGIKVDANDIEFNALKLFDLWVYVPEEAPEYSVGVEVYVDDERIGTTEPQLMNAGIHKWDEITVENYKDGTYPDHWHIQPTWETLEVRVVIYKRDKMIASSAMPVKLDAEGAAWLFDPPNLSFVSIGYSVNGGPSILFDMRNVEEHGIEISPGDTLELREVWYRSNAAGGELVLETYLTPGGYDPSTDKTTPLRKIERGIHSLDFTPPLAWTISGDQDYWVLWLVREAEATQGTVMDGLVVPLIKQ